MVLISVSHQTGFDTRYFYSEDLGISRSGTSWNSWSAGHWSSGECELCNLLPFGMKLGDLAGHRLTHTRKPSPMLVIDSSPNRRWPSRNREPFGLESLLDLIPHRPGISDIPDKIKEVGIFKIIHYQLDIMLTIYRRRLKSHGSHRPFSVMRDLLCCGFRRSSAKTIVFLSHRWFVWIHLQHVIHFFLSDFLQVQSWLNRCDSDI